jgi:hypothetical protein
MNTGMKISKRIRRSYAVLNAGLPNRGRMVNATFLQGLFKGFNAENVGTGFQTGKP